MSKSTKNASKAVTKPAVSGGLPANLQEELAREAAGYAANIRVAGESNMISTRNGVFTFRGESLGDSIDVVILNFAHVNEYYPDEFDPTVKKTPACYALSRSGENMTPHAEAPAKEAAACAGCPQSAIGSDPRRGGRACKQKIRLAIIHADDTASEDGVAEATICRIMVPAMSKSKLASYVKVLGDNPRFRVPPYAVITRIKLERHPKYQYVMEFEPLSIAPAESIGALRGRANGEALDAVMSPYPQLGNEQQGGGPRGAAPKTASRRSRFSA